MPLSPPSVHSPSDAHAASGEYHQSEGLWKEGGVADDPPEGGVQLNPHNFPSPPQGEGWHSH